MSRRKSLPDDAARPKTPSTSKHDALYAVFEHHLYDHSDPSIGRKQFVENVVKSYLEHLSKCQMVIPPHLRNSVAVELEEQVRVMLLKKTYGFNSVETFRSQNPSPKSGRKRN